MSYLDLFPFDKTSKIWKVLAQQQNWSACPGLPNVTFFLSSGLILTEIMLVFSSQESVMLLKSFVFIWQ